MPARGTELATYSIKNSASTLRTVQFAYGSCLRLFFFFFFFFFGCLLLLSNPLFCRPSFTDTIVLWVGYGKTQNLTGWQKPITRALPLSLAHSLLLFLTYIKPLEALFVSKLYDAQHHADTLHFFFTRKGKRMEDEAITRSFASSVGIEKMPICFSAYRHLASAFQTRLITTRSSPFAELQFGHSEETGRSHYGLSSSDPSPQALEWEFFQVSVKWQALIGLTVVKHQTYCFSLLWPPVALH